MSELISILMPVYNAALFLEECLDSIQAQTYPNWELLVVDDFSTDASRTILVAYAKKDQRIQVFTNSDKGIIPALRLAFEKSQGPLISRMDADDRMPPQKIEKMQHLLLAKGPGTVVTGLVKYFSATGIQGGYQRYERWLNELTLAGRQYEEIYRECVIPSPAWMLHRADLLRCGAFEPDRYPEDYDLVFRFYEQGLKVAAVSEVLHEWRDHPQRSSRTMEQYANAAYFSLKIPYFLALDYDPDRPLVVWGAGPKGKSVARILQSHSVAFHWVCDTPTKIGQRIYEVAIESSKWIETLDAPQVLVLVSNPIDQANIKLILADWGLCVGQNYFFMV